MQAAEGMGMARKKKKQPDADNSILGDVDWKNVSTEWEVDCFSRPVMREGKKMWELMVCDSSGAYRRVAQMKPTRVNSVVVQKLLKIFIEESKVKPQTIRFFRKVMKNMLTVAMQNLSAELKNMEELKILPSRNCHTLRLWMAYREVMVYPQMQGFIEAPVKRSAPVQTSMVQLQREKLPEMIKFTRYTMSRIPASFLMSLEPGQLPGSLASIPLGMDPEMDIYGIMVFSSRAQVICAVLKTMELAALRVDLESNELLLDFDIDTTYRVDKVRGDEKAEFIEFERSKRNSWGYHFFAVHDPIANGEDPRLPSPGETNEAGLVSGIWTLIDYTPWDEQ